MFGRLTMLWRCRKERPHPRAAGYMQYRFIDDGTKSSLNVEIEQVLKEEFQANSSEAIKFFGLLKAVFNNNGDLEDRGGGWPRVVYY